MPLKYNTGMLFSQYILDLPMSFFNRWHCEQYPSSVPLLQEHVMEVWGTVAYPYTGLPKLILCLNKILNLSYIDNSKSVAPLYPFSQDELVKILGVMPYLQGNCFFWYIPTITKLCNIIQQECVQLMVMLCAY